MIHTPTRRADERDERHATAPMTVAPALMAASRNSL
jgi:hypothetical protein